MALSAENLELARKLNGVFFPYLDANRQRMIKEGGRFVHYTTAENALKILTTKCIWMRNATCMADYQEVQHGYAAIGRYLMNNRKKFDSAFDGCLPGIAGEALQFFDAAWHDIQVQTYFTSISEHDKSEDIHGRLSMWRAFGAATAGVAIVMNLPMTIGINANMGCLLSPVGYFNDEELSRELDTVLDNVNASQQFLKTLDRNFLRNTIFMLLLTNIASMKHEGFREEREWRIIHVPKILPSRHLQSSIEVVSGVPQRIHKIPLKNDAEYEIVGLDPSELFDRLIIGPSQYPVAMLDAFVTTLEGAGVSDPGSRISISKIPVRT